MWKQDRNLLGKSLEKGKKTKYILHLHLFHLCLWNERPSHNSSWYPNLAQAHVKFQVGWHHPALSSLRLNITCSCAVLDIAVCKYFLPTICSTLLLLKLWLGLQHYLTTTDNNNIQFTSSLGSINIIWILSTSIPYKCHWSSKDQFPIYSQNPSNFANILNLNPIKQSRRPRLCSMYLSGYWNTRSHHNRKTFREAVDGDI